jgi:hypothetical protein
LSQRRDDATRSALRKFLAQALLLAAVFGATVGIAELAGAANLGTAFGIGQIAFVVALLVVILRS